MPAKMKDDPNRPICTDCNQPMVRHRGKAQSGRQRYRCNACGVSTTGSGDTMAGYDTDRAHDRCEALRGAVRRGANRFVITTALNNSPVLTTAWRSLRNFCTFNQAHLLVIPCHYKNVSLFTANQDYNKWFAKAVQPYIVDQNIRIGPKTYVMASTRIQATAVNPVSGLQPLAGDKWAIFGHSQQTLVPVATPITDLPGRMYTTGAITRKSYSHTKVGAKAAFHHVVGALLVEVQGARVFIRQLNMDHKGQFQDLNKLYTPDGVKDSQTAEVLTMGDEHVKWMLPNVKKQTFTDPNSIVNTMRPQYLVRHDVLDFYAKSHHHEKSYRTQYKKWYNRDDNVHNELMQMVDHINETTPEWAESLLVNDSNHHDHLEQWISRADPRKDHLNADLICDLQGLIRDSVRAGEAKNLLEMWMKPHTKVKVTFLDPNEPHLINGVDHSQHGHKGANGARGSAQGIANTTHKATIGHSHSAQIVKSVFQVGKSCGTLEYESGLSTHTNTHCLQYPNGKRTLIDILGNGWRATNPRKRGGLKI